MTTPDLVGVIAMWAVLVGGVLVLGMLMFSVAAMLAIDLRDAYKRPPGPPGWATSRTSPPPKACKCKGCGQ